MTKPTGLTKQLMNFVCMRLSQGRGDCETNSINLRVRNVSEQSTNFCNILTKKMHKHTHLFGFVVLQQPRSPSGEGLS